MSQNKLNSFIGWTGAFLVVFGYCLLSFEVVNSKDLTYNFMNLLGGIMLAYRVYIDKNMSNFALEIVFILIALKSIIVC